MNRKKSQPTLAGSRNPLENENTGFLESCGWDQPTHPLQRDIPVGGGDEKQKCDSLQTAQTQFGRGENFDLGAILTFRSFLMKSRQEINHLPVNILRERTYMTVLC